jgi:hypothetical protein
VFYAFGDVRIKSELPLDETAGLVARALEIPRFVKDISTPEDEGEDFVSRCFGLKFVFFALPESVAAASGCQFGLSIDTTADFDYDGSEKEIDAVWYVLFLLGREPRLSAVKGGGGVGGAQGA